MTKIFNFRVDNINQTRKNLFKVSRYNDIQVSDTWLPIIKILKKPDHINQPADKGNIVQESARQATHVCACTCMCGQTHTYNLTNRIILILLI